MIGDLVLPDQNDRHVLAAAIAGRVDVTVTCNLKDFPRESLRPHGIEAQHPDEFLHHLLDLAPGLVCEAARRCRERKKKSPYSAEEYLTALERRELTQFVECVS